MRGGKDARQQVTGSHFHIEGARQKACRCALKHIPCKMHITNYLKVCRASMTHTICKLQVHNQTPTAAAAHAGASVFLVHVSDLQQGVTFEPTILSPILQVEGRLLAAGNSRRHVWGHLQSSPQQPVCALLFKITRGILRTWKMWTSLGWTTLVIRKRNKRNTAPAMLNTQKEVEREMKKSLQEAQ